MAKVFNRGNGEISRSLRLTKDMDDAIEKLAAIEGESATAMIRVLLDETLQLRAHEGKIDWPKGFDVTILGLTPAKKKKN